MATIKASALSAEALAGCGSLLSGPLPAVKEGFGWLLTQPELAMSAKLCVGHMLCASRGPAVTRMERHLRTPEILVALEGESLLCLARPSAEPQRPVALFMRAGEALVMNTGTWHALPVAVGSAPSRFLVIFRQGTGDDDLHFADLPEPLQLGR